MMPNTKEGTIIGGKYQVLKKIWSSDFGLTFIGSDLQNFSRFVIIKEPLPHLLKDTKFVEMFVNEAKTLASLSHPNIPRFYDLVQDPNPHFIVMEYIQGINLSRVLDTCRKLKKKIPIELGAYIVLEAAKAIEHSHQLDICHRDFNPTNIMLSHDGHIKLIDFGVAKGALQRIKDSDKGYLIGKISYMSPEQIQGHNVDYKSDIYSLGVVLFEVLTGDVLFKNKNNEKLKKIIIESKIDKKIFESEIPIELKKLVLLSTQKASAQRKIDAQDIHTKIEEFLHIKNAKNLSNSLKSFLADLYSDSDVLSIPEDVIKTKNELSKKREEEKDKKSVSQIVQRPKKSKEVSSFEAVEEERTVWERVVNAGRKHINIIKTTSRIVGILALLWIILDPLFGITDFGKWIYDIIKPPSLRVVTFPEGAEVFIDGMAMEEPTPLRVGRLSPGIHTIVCKMDGFNAIEEAIEIPSKQKNILYKRPFSREIFINSNPQVADVIINRQLTNIKTPCSLYWEVDKPFSLELALDGYNRILDFELDCLNGKPKYQDTRIWNVSTDTGSVLSYGIVGHFYKYVQFHSNPPGAYIYIDGEKSPAQRTGQKILLTVGSHKIEMKPSSKYNHFNQVFLDLNIDRETPYRVRKDFLRNVTITVKDSIGNEIHAQIVTLRPQGQSEIKLQNSESPFSHKLPYYDTEVVLKKNEYRDTTVVLGRDKNHLSVLMQPKRETFKTMVAKPQLSYNDELQIDNTKQVDKTDNDSDVVVEIQPQPDDDTKLGELPDTSQSIRKNDEPIIPQDESDNVVQTEPQVVDSDEFSPFIIPDNSGEGIGVEIAVLDETSWDIIGGVSISIKKSDGSDAFQKLGVTGPDGILKVTLLQGVYDIQLVKHGWKPKIISDHQVSKDKGASIACQLRGE